MRYESGERGLLRESLTAALTRALGLHAIAHRGSNLLFPAEPSTSRWSILRQEIGAIEGNLKSTPPLKWHEGIAVRLDWADDRLWLLFEPRTVFEGIQSENRGQAADFARERTVRRYNRQLNSLIHFWSSILSNEGKDLRALGIGDGVDAVFRLSADTAYSWRTGA